MIIDRLRAYLHLRRRASLADLALHVQATPEAVRAMLARLEKKGVVRRLPVRPLCEHCVKCDPATLQFYEWVDPVEQESPP